MAELKDSGSRRQFETGAVRDICEGKGRCDLLPLDVVARIMDNRVIGYIDEFQKTGDTTWLVNALGLGGGCLFGGHENMILEVAKQFEDGARKYGDDNWRKGIPVHCYIDSGVRHYLKYLRGDTDEPHDRAFCWNLMCAIWTVEHMPELNEYPREVKK